MAGGAARHLECVYLKMKKPFWNSLLTGGRLLSGGVLMLVCAALATGACSPTRTTPAPQAETSSPGTLPPASAAATITVGTTAVQPTAVALATATPDITAAVEPSATATAGDAVPAPVTAVCSPLEDVTLAELAEPDLLKNPFEAPRPGMDDGHFGADFAYWSRGAHKQMLGLPVRSVLHGRVAGVIHNRMPYGNAVIIETSLSELPDIWQPVLPTPAPTVQPLPNLYCPPDSASYASDAGQSLYLLYAHLDQDPLVSLQQEVTCGQVIGAVGTTGRSVNAHLHLETRTGPANVTFADMAHYDNAATESEMAVYCTWRVSGLFQAFDPLDVLSLQP